MAKAKKQATAIPLPDTVREIAAVEARLKQLRGEPLSRQNLRDVDWLENRDRARFVSQWQAAVPTGEYCQLAGRQHKLVDDAAGLYDLPLDGPTVDLREAIRALHDLIASNAHRIRDPHGDLEFAELKEEKLRQEIGKLEKENAKAAIDLDYARGNAIPRAAVRDGLVMLQAQLRTLGQVLGRISPEARDALHDALTSLAAEIESGSLAF